MNDLTEGEIIQIRELIDSDYLVEGDLKMAELDRSLTYIASTYDAQNDRLVAGIGSKGPRVLTIAPSLMTWKIPLNDALKSLLEISENALENEQPGGSSVPGRLPFPLRQLLH